VSWVRKGLALALLLLLAPAAQAACSVTATGLNFGPYDVFDTAALTTTGTVSVACDEAPAVDVTISISQSLHSGLFNPRQLKHASTNDRLNYNLYADAGRTLIWGDGSAAATVVVTKKVPPNNKPRIETIYASIPPGQNAPVGLYGDTLTVTIVW
jgi:spore coat protein U-like protein